LAVGIIYYSTRAILPADNQIASQENCFSRFTERQQPTGEIFGPGNFQAGADFAMRESEFDQPLLCKCRGT